MVDFKYAGYIVAFLIVLWVAVSMYSVMHNREAAMETCIAHGQDFIRFQNEDKLLAQCMNETTHKIDLYIVKE